MFLVSEACIDKVGCKYMTALVLYQICLHCDICEKGGNGTPGLIQCHLKMHKFASC